MVFNKTFYLYVCFFLPLGLQYKISLNKFARQKQALAALTWINVSTAMVLSTTLKSFLDLHIIGKETLSSPTR